ncbi:hypothetical protein QTG56_26060 (plasmid) [Rossellomorea sp. AcN35-11]|nr:hypothetical protein [Rossellomorea aquimaris]WJV32082.1 hypothetical protein QTG56_26060 [Rossellomorea sp. AcN35-11]
MKENYLTDNSQKFWMVVYSLDSGDFRNATMTSTHDSDIDKISDVFESNNPDYRVIHIGKGALPPKTYRSLQYVN